MEALRTLICSLLEENQRRTGHWWSMSLEDNGGITRLLINGDQLLHFITPLEEMSVREQSDFFRNSIERVLQVHVESQPRDSAARPFVLSTRWSVGDDESTSGLDPNVPNGRVDRLRSVNYIGSHGSNEEAMSYSEEAELRVSRSPTRNGASPGVLYVGEHSSDDAVSAWMDGQDVHAPMMFMGAGSPDGNTVASEGQMYFNTATDQMMVFVGNEWHVMGSSSESTPGDVYQVICGDDEQVVSGGLSLDAMIKNMIARGKTPVVMRDGKTMCMPCRGVGCDECDGAGWYETWGDFEEV